METTRILIKTLTASKFARSASMLVGGSAASQGIAILALPVLTRLYTPEAFSLLAVYVAILTTLSVAACLRLEIALPIPESDSDAANLLALSFVSVSGFSLVVGVLAFCFANQIASAFNQPQFAAYIWMLPIGVWIAGTYSAIQYWSTRKKRFNAIAKTRIVQATSGVAVQLMLGWAKSAYFGLLLGHMIMTGAGTVALLSQTWKLDRVTFDSVRWERMKELFREYIRFPKYSTFETIFLAAGVHVPFLIIAALGSVAEAGLLMLATRLLGTPMSLLGGAVGQVYYSRASEAERQGDLARLSTRVVRILAIFAVGPLIYIATISPSLFGPVFGDEWKRSGEIVIWMAPSYAFRLLSSPISMVMHVRMQQEKMLLIAIFGFTIRVLPVVAIYLIAGGWLTEAYAVSSCVFYAAGYILFSLSARISVRNIVSPLFQYAVLWILCVFLGLMTLKLIQS